MALRDPRPVMDAGAAKRIDAETELRAANDVQVDHVAEVADVGAEIVVPMRRRGAQSLLIGNPFHPFEPGFEQRIRLRLDPVGDSVVRRPAIRRDCI